MQMHVFAFVLTFFYGAKSREHAVLVAELASESGSHLHRRVHALADLAMSTKRNREHLPRVSARRSQVVGQVTNTVNPLLYVATPAARAHGQPAARANRFHVAVIGAPIEPNPIAAALKLVRPHRSRRAEPWSFYRSCDLVGGGQCFR